jgi:hypothetical protein
MKRLLKNAASAFIVLLLTIGIFPFAWATLSYAREPDSSTLKISSPFDEQAIRQLSYYTVYLLDDLRESANGSGVSDSLSTPVVPDNPLVTYAPESPTAPSDALFGIPMTSTGTQDVPEASDSLTLAEGMTQNARNGLTIMGGVAQDAEEKKGFFEDARQRYLPEDDIPRANAFKEELSLIVWQPGESWSLGNSLLSVVGLAETLAAIGYFLYRGRRSSLNLLSSEFMLKALSLCFAVIAIISTSITSDFTRPVVVFDKMSLSLALLFGAQQMLLFGMRKLDTLDSIGEKKSKRFRAKRRYES